MSIERKLTRREVQGIEGQTEEKLEEEIDSYDAPPKYSALSLLMREAIARLLRPDRYILEIQPNGQGVMVRKKSNNEIFFFTEDLNEVETLKEVAEEATS